jgi:hypothetical protein
MSKINKRVWLAQQEAKEKGYLSQKSSSRVFCLRARRPKFLYETEAKAILAIEYGKKENIGTERYYPCSACAGYHLTSKGLEEYLEKKFSYISQRQRTRRAIAPNISTTQRGLSV